MNTLIKLSKCRAKYNLCIVVVQSECKPTLYISGIKKASEGASPTYRSFERGEYSELKERILTIVYKAYLKGLGLINAFL